MSFHESIAVWIDREALAWFWGEGKSWTDPEFTAFKAGLKKV